MRQIIFLDHIYHSQTKSSNFFREFLSSKFKIHTFYIDPDNVDVEKLWEDVSRVVDSESAVYIWQLDFLAPLFLAMGVPVFCSPMYDGSGGLPVEHWQILRDVRFVNFSVDLHEKARQGGATSLYVKYFPAPRGRIEFGTGLRAFFWRRRPEHGLDVELVDRIFGSHITSLHVHDVQDTPAGKAIQLNTTSLRYPVTRSTWFEDAAEMRSELERCNFYIAPRVAEGIGMGFLEAMSMGMLVAAYDAPTHNEYILSWNTGILFNKTSQGVGSLEEASLIAERGYNAAMLGWQNWLEQQSDILSFFATPASTARYQSFTRNDAIALVRAYGEGMEGYKLALRTAMKQNLKVPSGVDSFLPRILLGRGFKLIEAASNRFFPVRVVWSSSRHFSIVPIDDGGDLILIFRSGSGKELSSDELTMFTVWHGAEQKPAVLETMERSAFFCMKLARGTYKAYENLDIKVVPPLPGGRTGIVEGDKKLGFLLCEAGVRLEQFV